MKSSFSSFKKKILKPYKKKMTYMKEGGERLRDLDLVKGTFPWEDLGDLDRDLDRDLLDLLGEGDRVRLLRGEGVRERCLDLGGVLQVGGGTV